LVIQCLLHEQIRHAAIDLFTVASPIRPAITDPATS
jgi:hypothetical protein